MRTRPFGPDERVDPGGVPQPAPLRTVASPASQALAAGAVVIAIAALAVRMDATLWFAAPTAALLLGIVLGLQLDLRRWLAPVPGVVAALVTLIVLSGLWGVARSSFEMALPYAPVPLAAVVAFGADWWWVERLRPTTLASGVLLVAVLTGETGMAATLPLVLLWFAVVAAALWSLRGDAGRAVPTPVPLVGSAPPTREPGAARTALAVAASWLVAGLLIALVGLIPLGFDSPRTSGRPGADGIVGPGAGQGGGDGTPGGGDIGPGLGEDTIGGPGEDRDVDGDGIPDVDIDGDGIPDIDLDGDGVPDGSAGPGATAGRGGVAPGPDAGGAPPDDGRTARTVGRDDGARAALRVLGALVVVLLAAALVALAVRALARARARRRALAARPWAVRLTERLEREGTRRGRGHRRDEPVTRYATALAGGVLAHERLADVGAALSTALFGGGAPSDATGAWAARVVDEAVAANPRPTRRTALRARLRRLR